MFPSEMPDTCTQVWTLTHWFKNQSFVLQASQPVKNDAKRAHFQLYYTAGIFTRKWKQIFVKNLLGNTRNSISSIQTNSCYDSSWSTGWLIRKKWNVIPCGETIEIPVFPGQRPQLGDNFRILNALVTKFMWTQEAENAQVPPPVILICAVLD